MENGMETAGSVPAEADGSRKEPAAAAMRRADQWLSGRTAGKFAVMAVDINYFSLYNQIYGTEAGDGALQKIRLFLGELSERCEGISEYLGEDDFCLFISMDGLSQSKLRRNILSALPACTPAPGFEPVFGIYITDEAGRPAEELYKIALSIQKPLRGNYREHVGIQDREKREQLLEAEALPGGLLQAIENGEFIFDLQPCVDLDSQKVVSMEALVRWKKNGRVMAPGLFLSFLEKSGHIYALDRYLWEEICRMQRTRIDRGRKSIPVSVNLSPADFHYGDLVGYLSGLCEKYALEPSLIELEVPERTCVMDYQEVSGFLREAGKAGFRILIDNYGRGHISRDFVRELRVSALKIDRNYVLHFGDWEESPRVISAAVDAARELGLRAVVKGVETREQENTLRELGCECAQGFHYVRHMVTDVLG